VVAASVNILKLDESPATDRNGTEVGTLITRSFVYAATYSTPIGERLNAGLNYKVLRFAVDCSGLCTNVEEFAATTSALDFGAQFTPSHSSPVTFGAAVRNVGIRLQVNDNEQADPLPTRVELGLSYNLAFIAKYVSDIQVRAAADVIATETADDPSGRLGVDLTYEKTVHLRGGYIANDADGAKAAVGFGLGTGRLLFDIARTFGGLSEDAGKTPTYISLRFTF
jgi:hypothetical protein